MNIKVTFVILVAVMTGFIAASAQTPQTPQAPGATTPAPQPARANRPPPPTRDPNTPGYVKATALPDGAIPAADAYGNFIIGPTYTPAPELAGDPAVLEGTVHTFTMESKDSKIYPGIRREQGTFGTPDPNNPAKLDVTTSAPAPYTRRVAVYIPKQYVPGDRKSVV